MKFSCPACGQHLEADEAMAGQRIACPTCAGPVRIPTPFGAEKSPLPSNALSPDSPGSPSAAAESRSAGLPTAAHDPKAEAASPSPVGEGRGEGGPFETNVSDIPSEAPRLSKANDKLPASRRTVPALALAAVVLLLLSGAGGWWFLASHHPGGAKTSAAKQVLALFTRPDLASIKVFPDSINLKTRQDSQSLVVQAIYADGVTRDVTAQASYSFDNRSLVKMDKQTLHPVADGKTDLRVKFEGHELTVPVVVADAKVERPLSFKLDVMPVFMKAGCNSGSCHGTSRGKDGFHLSLFGYDPEGDYYRLTQESIGRRINLALPGESLIIEKGLGTVPHTGGERFRKDGDLHKTLLRWLSMGAPNDTTNATRVVSLELMPRQAVLEGSNATQRLTVRAKYSDGTDRDVTSLAVFISNTETCAKVSETGLVTAAQRGEAFIMARFDTFNVGAQIIVIPKDLPYTFPTDVAAYNYIDELVYAKLKKLRLSPSGLCDDATFLRRAYLDLTGALPPPEEVKKFLPEPSAGKRDQLIDDLLNRKEFADLWVLKWAELLQIRSRQDQFSPKAALQYYNWLQDKLAHNVPINEIVQELLTASGSTFRNPAANYYQVQTETLKTAENAAQVFMGMRIQCAQCHNHPFDRWTMNDYYSFAAFFPQVGRKPGEDPREQIIFDKGEGEVKHPVGNRVMAPKFLGGAVPELNGRSRREVLAKWLASPENPYFAKNLANIVWAHFMGKGIIDPVDDVRISNPASNPELLDALGAKFTEYNYDFKKLVRDICSSRTYQLATRTNDTNALDDRNFSHAGIRRMRAEVLLDCITEVTETKDKFPGLPRGARAVQIADGAVNNYFLTTFGRATRETVCSCEVKTEPNLSQALHLLNGNTVSDKIQQGDVVPRLLKDGRAPEEIIEDLYLRCLARQPSDKERSKLKGFLNDAQNPEPALNDLFWSLLNSKEFIFNH